MYGTLLGPDPPKAIMSNIGLILKNEISRLSRREIRKEVQPLRKAAAAHRREIAALKRTIAVLERSTKNVAKAAATQGRTTPATGERPTRFVAKGLISLRKRLGLSASELAKLLGVSMQSIYNWEHKKASPRKEQVVAIAALRLIGKKEAHERLKGPHSRAKKRPSTPKKKSRRNAKK
jgi:DNA-binding transcriptional regulator YiaG